MTKKGDGYVSLLNESIRGSRRTFHGPAIAKLKGQRNVIPVISMKEEEIETNEWRGKGVYERLQRVIAELHREKIFFGTSVTVTRRNFALVTDAQRAEEAEEVLIDYKTNYNHWLTVAVRARERKLLPHRNRGRLYPDRHSVFK